MEKKPLKYKKGVVKPDRNGFTFIDIYNITDLSYNLENFSNFIWGKIKNITFF